MKVKVKPSLPTKTNSHDYDEAQGKGINVPVPVPAKNIPTQEVEGQLFKIKDEQAMVAVGASTVKKYYPRKLYKNGLVLQVKLPDKRLLSSLIEPDPSDLNFQALCLEIEAATGIKIENNPKNPNPTYLLDEPYSPSEISNMGRKVPSGGMVAGSMPTTKSILVCRTAKKIGVLVPLQNKKLARVASNPPPQNMKGKLVKVKRKFEDEDQVDKKCPKVNSLPLTESIKNTPTALDIEVLDLDREDSLIVDETEFKKNDSVDMGVYEDNQDLSPSADNSSSSNNSFDSEKSMLSVASAVKFSPNQLKNKNAEIETAEVDENDDADESSAEDDKEEDHDLEKVQIQRQTRISTITTGLDASSLKCIATMNKELLKANPNMEKIEALMESTYSVRENLVDDHISIPDLLEAFPAFKYPNVISQEFARRCNIRVDTLIQKLDPVLKKMYQDAARLQKSKSHTLLKEALDNFKEIKASMNPDEILKVRRNLGMLVFCIKKIGPIRDGVLFKRLVKDKNPIDQIPTLAPFILLREGDLAGTSGSTTALDIYVERCKILTTDSFFDAVLYMYMMYWNVWMEYEKSTKSIYEAFEELLN